MPDPLALFEPHFKDKKSCGDEMQAFCPAHADREARSLTYRVDDKSGNLLVRCHAGCSYEAIATACGLPVSAMFAESKDAKEVAHVYTYRTEDGTPSRDVIRFTDGSYSQRSYRADGSTVNNVKGTPVLPYRLNERRPAIERGDTIWVPEGEKDCETLRDHGFCATTFPNGCQATWGPDHAEHLRPAKRIVVLTDCDEGEPGTGKRKGREAAHDRALLLRTITDDVTLLDLAPDRHDGFDVTNWFEGGGDVEELERLADEAKTFPASTVSTAELAIPQDAKSAVREFTKIYDDIRARSDLSVYDKIVLAEVIRDGEMRANPKFKVGRKMSFQTIADGWKISRRVVVKSLKRLQDDGFIVAHRTSGGRQRMNHYDAVVPIPPQTVHAVHRLARTNSAPRAPFVKEPAVRNSAPHALVECTRCTGPVHGVHSHIERHEENDRDETWTQRRDSLISDMRSESGDESKKQKQRAGGSEKAAAAAIVASDGRAIHEACGQGLPWRDADGKMRCMRCDTPSDVDMIPRTRDATRNFFTIPDFFRSSLNGGQL